MKNRIRILIPLLAAAVLATGCMSEPKEPEVPNPGGKTITFNFPTAKGIMTYVNSEQGEDDMSGMVIYMFNSDTGMLERIFRGTEIKAGTDPVSNKPTATIDVTERSGPKTFYFVANHSGITSALDKVKFNQTTMSEFEQFISDVQTTLPVTPLLMSCKKAVLDVENVTALELDIQMTRRVARFDVDNTDTQTNFTIKRIVIGNVNRQAYIFGDATAIPGKVLDAGNMPHIIFDAMTGANAGVVKSVFYTYPTTINPDKTDISFEGVFNGQTGTYSLATTPDFEIEANKRYILKPKKVDINKIEIEISVKDWDEGTDVPSETEKNRVEVDNYRVTSGGGKLSADNSTLDLYGPMTLGTTTLQFTTRTFRSPGTKIEIEYLLGDETIMPIVVNNPPVVMTYGAAYEQQYVATFEKISVEDAEAVIKIVNISDPFNRQFIHISQAPPKYPGINARPVQVGGVYWAPINVGATTMNGTNEPADAGKMFQWGRDYVSWAYDESSYTTSNSNNSISEAQAKELYGTQFITNMSWTPYDWVSPQNNNLWNDTNNNRGPCPEGWRLPKKTDMDLLVAAQSKATLDNGIIRIEGDKAGEYLYLQLGGVRMYSDGSYQERGTMSYYWSSTFTGTNAHRLNITNGAQLYVGATYRSNGHYVRCVYDKQW